MPNIIVGLLALAFGLWGLSVWWWSVTELLRGLVPLILLAVGFIALAAGISNVQTNEAMVKNKKRTTSAKNAEKTEDSLDQELKETKSPETETPETKTTTVTEKKPIKSEQSDKGHTSDVAKSTAKAVKK